MEWIGQVINFVTENVSQILQVVGAFAIIATWTKNSSDDKIVKWIYEVINLIGCNFGNAKNKD